MRRLLAVIILASVASGCIYLGQPDPQCPVAATSLSVEEQAVFDGLGPKTNDLWLQRSAQLLAQDEADADTSSHVDEFGNHLADRMTACRVPNVDQRYANEVIPYGGDGSPQPVLDALHDPANAPNVGDFWDAKYTEAAVSVRQAASGTWYWVIVVTS